MHQFIHLKIQNLHFYFPLFSKLHSMLSLRDKHLVFTGSFESFKLPSAQTREILLMQAWTLRSYSWHKERFWEFLELQKMLTKASDCQLDDAGMGRRWNKSLQNKQLAVVNDSASKSTVRVTAGILVTLLYNMTRAGCKPGRGHLLQTQLARIYHLPLFVEKRYHRRGQNVRNIRLKKS